MATKKASKKASKRTSTKASRKATQKTKLARARGKAIAVKATHGGKAAKTAKKATRRAAAKAASSTKSGASSKKRAVGSATHHAARRRIETISADIVRSRRLGKGVVWVIEAEVHVRAGATLTVADGATILIRNGLLKGSRLRRAALVFDPGSGLSAKRLSIRAANEANRPVRVADNGGVWFLGTFSGGSSDGITVKRVRGAKPSAFRATSLTVSHLGRGERDLPRRGRRAGGERDDIDALKLIGVGPEEWRIAAVRSLHSADDGFDVTNSHVALDRLEVRSPTEDGLNITSSRITIRRSLVVDAPRTKVADRDLFDLETDDGAAYVELPRGCHVRLRGVFGDQLHLTSSDMPKPVTTADNERRYAFSGKLKADALIHSLTED
jgi:hypothetical protein